MTSLMLNNDIFLFQEMLYS